MGPYPKTAVLKDGIEVMLRPMEPEDLDRSHRFFLALPEEDRLYLRMDLTDRANVAIRMEQSDAEEAWRLVALKGEEIIGDATLFQPRYGWKRHTGEIRCVVAHAWQGRGLGRTMVSELLQEATRRGIEKVLGAVAAEQTAGLKIVDALGFKKEMTLRDHQRTLHGDLHDIILMTVNLSEAWQRMEDLMQQMDGQTRESHVGGKGAS